jgi:hypothetical protein
MPTPNPPGRTSGRPQLRTPAAVLGRRAPTRPTGRCWPGEESRRRRRQFRPAVAPAPRGAPRRLRSPRSLWRSPEGPPGPPQQGHAGEAPQRLGEGVGRPGRRRSARASRYRVPAASPRAGHPPEGDQHLRLEGLVAQRPLGRLGLPQQRAGLGEPALRRAEVGQEQLGRPVLDDTPGGPTGRLFAVGGEPRAGFERHLGELGIAPARLEEGDYDPGWTGARPPKPPLRGPGDGGARPQRLRPRPAAHGRKCPVPARFSSWVRIWSESGGPPVVHAGTALGRTRPRQHQALLSTPTGPRA